MSSSLKDPNVNSPPIVNLNLNNQTSTMSNHQSSAKAVNKKSSRLNVIHWNCNSLMGKRPYIGEFLRAERPDILCLNEIKCKNEEEANLFSRFDNYFPKFKIRSTKTSGGGVLMLIHKDLDGHYNSVQIPNNIEDELIGITVKNENQKIDIYSVYVPPNHNISEEALEFIVSRKNEFIIAGDLNAIMPDLNGRYNRTGKVMEQQILKYNIVVLNNSKKPTSYRYLQKKMNTQSSTTS